MAQARQFWDELFGPGEVGATARSCTMRLLRKGGKPLLLLPNQTRAAAAALELYPAQSLRARLAKAALHTLLRAGWAAGTERLTFELAAEGSFTRFLRIQAGESGPAVPCFGVLAGNPAMASQRFLVLVFDARQRPVSVVKAGLSPSARELVQKEGAFLAAAAASLAGIPRVRANFQSARASAFALDHYLGRSPRRGEEGALPVLLGGWVDIRRTTTVAALADWQRLETAASHPSFGAIARALGARQLHPALYHGDLAPWNIRVSPAGQWTVLDWERGELQGLPTWDWFHYLLQTAILVERLPTRALVERLEGLLNSKPFQAYAKQAGITGLERPLALAYLLHCVEVLKPAEGLPATQALLSALLPHWKIT